MKRLRLVAYISLALLAGWYVTGRESGQCNAEWAAGRDGGLCELSWVAAVPVALAVLAAALVFEVLIGRRTAAAEA